MTIYVLNGPNLNMLGDRDPHLYGTSTLGEVEEMCREKATQLGLTVDFRQSNHEGQLIDWLQEARFGAEGVVLNAGGLSHYSIALRDAVSACDRPVVEVHISNIFAREEFRWRSVLSGVVLGMISGLGIWGYVGAIEALAGILKERGSSAERR